MKKMSVAINKKKSRSGNSSEQYVFFLENYLNLSGANSCDELADAISLFTILNYKSIEAGIVEHNNLFLKDYSVLLEKTSELRLQSSQFVGSKMSGNGLYLRRNKHVAYYSLLASVLQYLIFLERFDEFRQVVEAEFRIVANMVESDVAEVAIAYGNVVRLVFFKSILSIKHSDYIGLLSSGRLLIRLFKHSTLYLDVKSFKLFNELNSKFNIHVCKFTEFLERCDSSEGFLLLEHAACQQMMLDLYEAAIHGPKVFACLQSKIDSI